MEEEKETKEEERRLQTSVEIQNNHKEMERWNTGKEEERREKRGNREGELSTALRV